MPAWTMAPIEEEKDGKKEANVTMRRPLRGCSLSIVEESEEMPEIKKMEPEKPMLVEKVEVAKKVEDKNKKKKNDSQ